MVIPDERASQLGFVMKDYPILWDPAGKFLLENRGCTILPVLYLIPIIDGRYVTIVYFLVVYSMLI